jgi:futalosine hydrolase
MGSLLLIPTAYEKGMIAPEMLSLFRSLGIDVALCGFGLIASAAQTVRLITQRQPDRVILAGIAGLYRNGEVDEGWLGRAVRFDRVVCFGIGVGSGLEFKSSGQLGWSQLQSEQQAYPATDVIELDKFGKGLVDDELVKENGTTLLSVTAASANGDEARCKLACFPNALAEDMEGFGVATACQLCGVPISIARGFSNWVGDREHKNWKVSEAMGSVCELVIKISRSHSE